MGCWVVPALAAEFWKLPLAQVLAGIQDGSIPTKTENGFVFIDVMPSAQPPVLKRRPEDRPPTYIALTQQELQLLTDDTPAEEPDEDFAPFSDDEESADLTATAWNTSRRQVARTRQRPLAA